MINIDENKAIIAASMIYSAIIQADHAYYMKSEDDLAKKSVDAVIAIYNQLKKYKK